MFKWRKLIVGAGIGILLANVTVPSISASSVNESQQIKYQYQETPHLNSNLVEKVAKVGSYIYFKDNSVDLDISLSDQELMNNFGFSEQETRELRKVLSSTYQVSADNSRVKNQTTTFSTRQSGKRVYLSNDALTAGVASSLLVAAQTSPAALKAAFIALGSSVGPVGAVVAAGAAGFGAAFFADLAMKITGAIAQGRGVAFYFDWGWPPVDPVIE
ncbi:hypothetical protein [Dolosigranulum savutiense]|uniref:Uncharacterized protein n=1 Tax=Dolosigranulum savutiense TaxID=3110288 RepID=A0AB74TSL1_9LACT